MPKRLLLRHACPDQPVSPLCPMTCLMTHRVATLEMQSAIDAHALTQEQLEWGGSHDVILGLILWLYDIPVVSMHSSKSFYGSKILRPISPTAAATAGALNSSIFFHNVRRRFCLWPMNE